MSTLFSVLLVITCLLLTSNPATSQQQSKSTKSKARAAKEKKPAYPIEVARKIKAFDKYSVSSVYSVKNQMRAMLDGATLLDTTETFELRAQADVDILGVTVDGQEADKQILIRNFQKNTPNGFIDVLPTGTKIKSLHSSEADSYTIDGKQVADSIATMLTSVLRAEGGEKTSKILGTKESKSVGSTWKINAQEFMKNLPQGISPKAKVKSGIVTLQSVDTSASTPWQTIVAKIVTENITNEIANIPTRSSTLTTTITLELPNDVRLPPLAVTTQQVFEADTAPTVEQNGITTVLTTTSTTSTRYQR